MFKILDFGLSEGQIRYLEWKEDPRILAFSYYDRAKCHFITNMFRPDFVSNRKKNRVPIAIQGYRDHMGAIDRIDRSTLKSTRPHKNIKWSMSFFWYLLDLYISNSRTYYSSFSNLKIPIGIFLLDLTKEWLKSIVSDMKAPIPVCHDLIISERLSRCAIWKKDDMNLSKTKWSCVQCKVYLLPQCFGKYHRTEK